MTPLPLQFIRSSLVGVTVCLSVVTGCGKKPETDTEHAFQILEEDGIEVALTTGGPRYEGEIFEYVPVVTLQEDERPESLLFQPFAFLTDEDGNYYVGDFGDRRIAVFDDQGVYSFSIGRQGSGPGEFQFPSIQEIREGVISVFDPSNRRTTRFGTDGTFIDVTTLPGSIMVYPNAFLHLPGDRMLLLENHFDTESDGRYNSVSATVIDIDGDTLWTRRSDRVKTGFRGKRKRPDGSEYETTFSYALGYYPSISFSRAAGIVFNEGFAPQLDVYDMDGNLVRRVRIDLEVSAPTSEDLENQKAEYDKRIEEADENTMYIYESYRENIRMADVKAPWRSCEIDDYGYMWLMVTETNLQVEEAGGGLLYRVVSPEGEYLGDTRQPKGYGVVMRGKFLSNDMDADTEVYQLTAYEIRPAVPGLRYPHE